MSRELFASASSFGVPEMPSPISVEIIPEAATSRILKAPFSITYRTLLVSTQTANGSDSTADVAAPPSPPAPPPATLLIMLLESTLRTRLFPLSAIKTFPYTSANTPCGLFNFARVARAPSLMVVPVPANLVIMPDASTLRILLAATSAIYTLPIVSPEMD